jgi:hypothetical protein
LDTNVSDFFLSNQTIFEGVSQLNSQSIPLAFGFEKPLKAKFDGPRIPDPSISLSLRDVTLRQALDALCKADGRYSWSLDGSTVNIYPSKITNDPSYLLNRRLNTLKLENILDVQQGLLAIARQLPPPEEQLAHAQMGGDTVYPAEPWNVTLENLTVRQAINRLTEHMGAHSAWLFYGSEDFRAFSFYRLGFGKSSQ